MVYRSCGRGGRRFGRRGRLHRRLGVASGSPGAGQYKHVSSPADTSVCAATTATATVDGGAGGTAQAKEARRKRKWQRPQEGAPRRRLNGWPLIAISVAFNTRQFG